jgi:hypothetical protein
VLCPLVSSSSTFVPWSDVGSQFPTPDCQGGGSFQPSLYDMLFFSHVQYNVLYTLQIDAPACLECLGSGPSITQKLGVISPVRLLSSNIRVGK